MRKRHTGVMIGRIAAFAMAGVMIFNIPGVNAANGGHLTDQVDHVDLTFEELEYFDVTEEDFDAVVANLEEIASDINNAGQVADIIDQMEDLYLKNATNDAIASVYSTLDAENQEYNDLVMMYDELWTSLGDKIMLNYKIIAESACWEVLYERVDDEDEWQDILDYEPMTEEQKELERRISELNLRYDELYIADYVYEINGVEYDEDSLPDAYSAGVIDITQYFAGVADICEQRNQALGELFLEMVDIRTQLAKSYGYDNYADYAYAEIYDRDFSPEDLDEYRQQVIDYMVPVEHELYDLLFDDPDYMDMWDVEMSEQECLDTFEQYLPNISDDLLVTFRYMTEHGMYDLSVDDRKAPGGYTTQFYSYFTPFMFNCADGTISDMGTLIHEFGHYNQMYYASEEEWIYPKNNLDVAEIHSQGLEMLFLDYSEDIYGDYAYTVDLYTMMNMAYACVEGVKEDAFQYAVYSNPENLTIEKLNQIYYDVCLEYGSEEFTNSYYLGLYGFMAPEEITEWVEIPHTFQSPLYYVSYSVSMAAVEELWDVILDDREKGIDLYLDLVGMGLVDSYSDTLDAVGLNNPIENPRFDVYANNMRYYFGLVDSRDPSQETDSSEVVRPEEEQVDQELPDAEEEEDDSYEYSHIEDRPLVSWNTMLIALLVVGIVVLIVIVVVIIVLVSSGKKAKKQAEAGQGTLPMQNIPPAQNYMAPMQNIPPVQNVMPMETMPQVQNSVPPQNDVQLQEKQPENPEQDSNAGQENADVQNGQKEESGQEAVEQPKQDALNEEETPEKKDAKGE